ncbi:MAG: hypothetical protein ABI562_04475 [Chloroflexota bacterium]
MQPRLRAGLASLSVFLMCACQPAIPIPATLYTPEVAGVVSAVTPGDKRVTTFTLTDGTVATIDGAKSTAIKGSGNASVGDLLLTDHTSSWMSSLRMNSNADAPEGCFDLPNSGVDDGDYVKFTNGLRLRKAAGFDPGIAGQSTNGLYDYPQVRFCVDSTGSITSYGW